MSMFSLKSDPPGNGAVREAPALPPRSNPVVPAPQPVAGNPQDSNAFGRRTAPGQAGIGETVISSDLLIDGNVTSEGRVRLEGKIEGDMRCASLIVGENGSVTGTIHADEIAVHGRVAGTVRGRSVNLYKTAHVEGDIYHEGIGIEMGTHYDGRLKWSGYTPDQTGTTGRPEGAGAPAAIPMNAPGVVDPTGRR